MKIPYIINWEKKEEYMFHKTQTFVMYSEEDESRIWISAFYFDDQKYDIKNKQKSSFLINKNVYEHIIRLLRTIVDNHLSYADDLLSNSTFYEDLNVTLKNIFTKNIKCELKFSYFPDVYGYEDGEIIWKFNYEINTTWFNDIVKWLVKITSKNTNDNLFIIVNFHGLTIEINLKELLEKHIDMRKIITWLESLENTKKIMEESELDYENEKVVSKGIEKINQLYKTF